MSRQRPFFELLLALAFGIVWAGAATVLLYAIIFWGPWIEYSWRSPSVKAECIQIKPGMDLQAVLAITSQRTEPYEQYLKGNRLEFQRDGWSCAVEFDATTRRVLRTHAEEVRMHVQVE